jgi:hypothetical protein
MELRFKIDLKNTSKTLVFEKNWRELLKRSKKNNLASSIILQIA